MLRTLALILVVTFLGDVLKTEALADDSRFKDYEIRVIRPKFFKKRERFELGGEFLVVMNDTFVYTMMASGILTYHFTESWALEGMGAFGTSINRSEKDVLQDEFEIKTEVFRTQYFLEGSILYTPIYGKVQLPKGKLMYFDTYLALGGGMTGVEWQYSDYCQEPNRDINTTASDIPSDQTVPYPTIAFGVGQRVFYSKSKTFRWDLRNHSVNYNTADSACNPDAGGGQNWKHNLILQIGASKFF